MALRSIGSFTISFGLVSIPIKLYTAASPQTVSFNLLHEKCGGRMKQQYFCPIDNEVVERDAMVKGYEIAKNQYVRFSDEDLKNLEGERTDRLDILEFVPRDSVDPAFIEKTYYLGPDKGGARAYKLLGEAMERTARVALGRLGTRGKEQLVMVQPYRGGLSMHYVHYADEVRSMDEVERPADITFKPVEEELADKLIAELSVDAFHPEQFHDAYRDRVVAAAEQKAQGREISTLPAQPRAEIVDLFEALKRSLKTAGDPPSETQAETPPRPLHKTRPRPAREKKAS
jgi:DNA end-binding protein Ku